MISIARNSLSSLFLSPNPFICKSSVYLSLSVYSFSTSRVKELIPSHCPEIYDVLVHNHGFSPGSASLAASHLPKFRNPKRADSFLSFLKENSFTIAQLEKLVIYKPRILGFTIEGIRLKLKVFQDLGLSSEEIAKMVSSNQMILHLSRSNNIIPSLSLLKGLLGSNHEVARLLRNSSWFLTADLEKVLMPNVETLKSCGIPMVRILQFLHARPRCFLLKPYIMRKSVDRAIEMGFSLTSVNFINAVSVFSCAKEGIWEVNLQALRDLGFSDNDISTMFRKAPSVFSLSAKRIKNVIELVLATGKYNISDIVASPVSLGYSIEKRLEPRLQILRVLESRDLIKKWPALGTVLVYTDGKFVDRFVRPYYNEIGKEYIPKIYIEMML
ncbi:hypothetical protein C2S53_017948 [Perilla frutescens var. hirtella]|uniref:Uncharacterized protein n=1 Tax=Perilla frutescens var. hirtella TaxID=608512 RepID=A0AAD4P580_PERFH|nr:hypothetical protein C2S53_017948 [Perilla frutescens var. hirtella]